MTACCTLQSSPVGLYDGAFASQPLAQNLELRGPFASTLTAAGAARSNTPGTVQGRFGWFNAATGVVNNTRLAASDKLGIVIPLRSLNGANGGVVGGPRGLAGAQASWTWEFWDPTVTPAGGLRIRPGLLVTMHSRGNFWLRFAGGAIFGNSVYANLADGSAISGPATGAELTPFTLCSTAPPGELAIVSSSAIFTP